MKVAELLYRLTARDLGNPWAGLYYRKVDLTDATTLTPTLTVDTVPTGRVLILTNAAYHGVGGGAQTVTQIALKYGTPAITPAINMVTIDQEQQAAAVTMFRNWQGEIWLPPTFPIVVQGVFSAFAIANTLRVSLTGFLIPLGTLTLP